MLKLILQVLFLTFLVNAYAEPEMPEQTMPVTESIDILSETAVEQLPDDIGIDETEVSEADEFTNAPAEEELEVITAVEEPVIKKDVFLVLDNSGSMKKNDPDFLVSEAVKEFISLQDANTRVGIVIFDQNVLLPVPLTEASLSNRETILNSIGNINYKGLYTDSPAGIERAIYELKNNGRDDAEKSIIFMTDGIVDTGAPEKDLEKSKWLREDLAPDAADNEIKIFGIAFTEAADFQLIQSIAQKTDGEYYRVLKAEELHGVFERINEIINEPPAPEPVPEPVVVSQPAPEPVEPVVQAPPPAPVIIEVPAQGVGQEERVRSIIMIAAAIILTITLLAILILLLKRNRELKSGEEQFAQEAYINDLQGKTEKQTHKLGTKPTMFGRVAGKDTDHLDYIVVSESTIGRRHALIEYKDYSYWIIDQGSINGTFVNDEPVKTEVRLKHGDRIRLHKCEFEFIMPEMEDSGMTVISNTVFAQQPAVDDSEEATEMRGSGGSNELSAEEIKTAGNADMDFDLTGSGSDTSDDLSDLYEPDPDEEDTVIRDLPNQSTDSDDEPDFTLDGVGDDDANSEDETIMLDDDADNESDDVDDDATLRKEDL